MCYDYDINPLARSDGRANKQIEEMQISELEGC